jgi:hypothetical protein
MNREVESLTEGGEGRRNGWYGRGERKERLTERDRELCGFM